MPTSIHPKIGFKPPVTSPTPPSWERDGLARRWALLINRFEELLSRLELMAINHRRRPGAQRAQRSILNAKVVLVADAEFRRLAAKHDTHEDQCRDDPTLTEALHVSDWVYRHESLWGNAYDDDDSGYPVSKEFLTGPKAAKRCQVQTVKTKFSKSGIPGVELSIPTTNRRNPRDGGRIPSSAPVGTSDTTKRLFCSFGYCSLPPQSMIRLLNNHHSSFRCPKQDFQTAKNAPTILHYRCGLLCYFTLQATL